jgi:hypothetical protein
MALFRRHLTRGALAWALASFLAIVHVAIAAADTSPGPWP